jgi:pimeloyl-ACP methyl ester carboxylesterase
VPQPRGVAYDQQRLSDERRYGVPVTIVACEYSSADLKRWIEDGHPYVAELARVRDAEYVDLPTGHWPQFTRPRELGEIIVAAVDRRAPVQR